jgi:hypothetical protein
MRKNNYAET